MQNSQVCSTIHIYQILILSNMETTNNIQNGTRTLVEKEAYFDIQFKYQDKAEKSLVDRFLKWKHNKYIAYAAINEDFHSMDLKGKSFLLYNQTLRNRFDELFPYSFIVADKQFIDNNYLPKEYNGMKRYIYIVSQQLYSEVVKQAWHPRSIEHKAYPGIRIFENYESLVEFLEERLYRQPIIIIGKEPWARLRYFIDELQLTYSDELPRCEDNQFGLFPLDKFQTFLNFATMKSVKHTVKTVLHEQTDEEVPEQLPELFSDYIKFSYKSSVLKKVANRKADSVKEEHFSYFTIVKKS